MTGNAQLVLGKALTEGGAFDEAARWLEGAKASFARRSSASHRPGLGFSDGR